MPKTCPPFVHYFGHRLRGEIVAFLADDGEAVGLPVFEGGVLEEVEQDVARRAGGGRVALLFLGVADLLLLGLDGGRGG